MTGSNFIRRTVAVFALLGVCGIAMACGSDDSDDGGNTTNACFALCADSTTNTCTSGPGLTDADCQTVAAGDCGGSAQESVLMTGCDCPGFDEPGECTDVPTWAQ